MKSRPTARGRAFHNSMQIKPQFFPLTMHIGAISGMVSKIKPDGNADEP